jgi:hypothetical protein
MSFSFDTRKNLSDQALRMTRVECIECDTGPLHSKKLRFESKDLLTVYHVNIKAVDSQIWANKFCELDELFKY